MRGCPPMGDGSAFDNKPGFARAGADEFVDQARFPYARFAAKSDDLTSACRGTLPCRAKLVDLGVASNEPRQAARCSRLQPRAYGLRAGDLMGFDRLGQPLYVESAEGLHLGIPPGRPQGRAGNEVRPRHRPLLHPSREMNGPSYGGVATAHVVADWADQSFAGIQSHPDLDWHTVRALNFLRISLYCLLHPKRGVAGAYAGVLGCERPSEQRPN